MIPKLASLALSLLTGSLWHWPLALLRWIAASALRIWAALALLALALAGWQAQRAAHWADTARQTQTAWDAERKAAQAAKLAYEAKSKKDAQDGDKNHTTLASGGDARFAAYAAAGHGLRENTAHRPGSAADHDPAIPENPSPDAIMAEISRVWITRSDWLTCDADWAYAQGAYDWNKMRSQE